MASPIPALATAIRVVAVPVPRADSAVGRVLAMLDADPDRQFTWEELAGILRVETAVVRQALMRLVTCGLVRSQPSHKRSGRQPVWLYRMAPDYSAHVRQVLEKGAER